MTVPWKKKHIFYVPKNKDSAAVGDLDMTYYSATATVLNALNKVKDEKGMKRVEKFLKEEVCPECHGTRLSEEARAPRLMGISLADACKMTLKDSITLVKHVPESWPEEMRSMAENICESYLEVAASPMDLGLGYLTLDRASSTLSTGERQRMQLARAVRNRTTGVSLRVDPRKGKDAAELSEMLTAWVQQADKLRNGEISREDYAKWRYTSPTYVEASGYVQVPSQQLSDALVEAFKDRLKND